MKCLQIFREENVNILPLHFVTIFMCNSSRSRCEKKGHKTDETKRKRKTKQMFNGRAKMRTLLLDNFRWENVIGLFLTRDESSSRIIRSFSLKLDEDLITLFLKMTLFSRASLK